jgi:hypothetical protein
MSSVQTNPLIAAAFSLALLSSAVHADVSTTTVTPPPAPAASSDGIRPQTEALYPIWENTGFVEKHRQIYLGTNGAHYGIQDVVQVGVQPINFLYRAPNVYTKFSLLQRDRWHVAGQVGAFYLMNEASRAFLSPMYSSRLDNPDFSVVLLPVTATATYELSDWLQLHQTATVLGVFSSSGILANQAYFGYTAVAELVAARRHSVLLHGGEVGFWDHDFSLVGASYRYHNTWFEFQLGYFYRFEKEGTQSAPMIALGLLF